MSDFNDQEDKIAFVETMLKSKYSDLIILSAVILAFLMLIILSATLT